MKKLIILLLAMSVFSGCKRQYFKEPLLDWTYTVNEVSSLEKRELIEKKESPPEYREKWKPIPNTNSYELELIKENEGRIESLVFAGNGKQLKQVIYVFDEADNQLSYITLRFVSNEKVKNELLSFMVKKYGEYYEDQSNDNKIEFVWDQQGTEITFYSTNSDLEVSYEENRQ